MTNLEMIDKVDKNMEDLNQEIQGITRMKFKSIIMAIEEARGKVHIMSVLLDSERLEEITNSANKFVNDICFDLDELTDEMKTYLKKHKKGA